MNRRNFLFLVGAATTLTACGGAVPSTLAPAPESQAASVDTAKPLLIEFYADW